MYYDYYLNDINIYSAEIARHLNDDSYGLVFGINTVLGLILQTILTLLVVSDGGFALNVIEQYSIYAYYFIGVGFLYIIFVIADYYYLQNLPTVQTNETALKMMSQSQSKDF